MVVYYTTKRFIINLGKNVLSLVFLMASILKSVNIHSFVLETQLYIDAYMADGLHPLAMIGAITVCAIEMLIALLAMKKEYGRVAVLGFCIMLSFFVYLTGLNLFFPTIMGSIESCGCFGELIHLTPTASFIKRVVLWIMSLVLVINSYREHETWNITKLIRDKYLYVGIAVIMVLPLYSLWFFEELDHTTYISGFTVLCIIISFYVIMTLRYSLKTKKYT